MPLTLMSSGADTLDAKDDAVGKPRSYEKMPTLWAGMTIFYGQRSRYDTKID